MTDVRVNGDFNGLFLDKDAAHPHELLCLSHEDTATDCSGNPITLHAGMTLTAVEPDTDENGRPDALLATRIVEAAPAWLQCRGSRWVLRIDFRGTRHESDDRASGIR